MEKGIKIGNAILKVYDFFVLILIFFIALSLAILNGAAQLNIHPYVIAFVIVGLEAIYIFGVIKRRNQK